MVKLLGVLVLFVGLSTSATEDVCEYDSQAAMNQCAAQSYKKADDALNMTWVELRVCKINSKEEWNMIVKSQKAWIQFKETQCEYEASLDWGIELRGSGWPLGYFGCLETMTKERTAFLQQQFVDCYEHSEPGEM